MPLLHLLIIDSHQVFRESAMKYLMRCRMFRCVEAVASYNEGMLHIKKYFPDLILVDSKINFENPDFIYEIEKLKPSNSALEVLILFLFEEGCINRCQLLSPLVSGIIFKESFADDLLEYLSKKKSCRQSGQLSQGG